MRLYNIGHITILFTYSGYNLMRKGELMYTMTKYYGFFINDDDNDDGNDDDGDNDNSVLTMMSMTMTLRMMTITITITSDN